MQDWSRISVSDMHAVLGWSSPDPCTAGSSFTELLHLFSKIQSGAVSIEKKNRQVYLLAPCSLYYLSQQSNIYYLFHLHTEMDHSYELTYWLLSESSQLDCKFANSGEF